MISRHCQHEASGRLSMAERLERNSIPEPNSGCLLWTARVNLEGYGRVGGSRTGTFLAHRAAWIECRGPIPEGLLVCHKCDVPSCINPDHLFLGTHTANMADMKRKDRAQRIRGERNNNAVLTAEKVIAIRADSRPFADIARDHGVSSTHVSDIVNRRVWNHVEAPND